MQSMDRNTVIGFVLLAVLLFAYLFISSRNSHELEVQKRKFDDSVALVNAQKQAIAAKKDSFAVALTKDTGTIATLFNAGEKTTTIENDVLKIVFTNKGAQPKSVQLKKYRSVDSSLVELENSSTDYLAYTINTENAQ